MPDQVAHTILEGHDIAFIDLEALGLGDGHALAVYDPQGGGGGGGGAVTIADGADVAEGATTDSFNLSTDATPASVIELLKAISYLLQNTTDWPVSIADGDLATLGNKADGRDVNTDNTALTIMQVLKEISYMEQNPASQAVTGSVAISAVVPGTTATDLGKAEDDAHNSGDVGVEVLAVRKDAATALAADGDYHPLEVNATGALRTNVDNIAALSVGAGATDASTLRVITASDGPVNTVLGTTADAAVSTDANGSINAHLRGMIVDLLAGITTKNGSLEYSADLTVTNGAYTIGDVVGGLLTIANAVSANGKSAYIDQVTLTGATSALTYELWLLNADLATANVLDNGVMAMVAADKPKVIAVIPLSSTDDFASPDATAVHCICARGVGVKVKAGASTTIYGYIKATATTSPGTTAMTVKISGSYCD